MRGRRGTLNPVMSAPVIDLPATPAPTRAWTPRRVLVTRSAADLPHTGEILTNSARALPAATMMMAGALVAGGFLVARAFEQRRY